MPRKNTIISKPGPFHITARCINKEWFQIPLNIVWRLFSDQLYFSQKAFRTEIHSFVLMKNHYHLLLSTPELNLSEFMAYFQRETSRELNRNGNRINRTFGGRYYKSYLNSYIYFLNCYKYIYQNPVRAGIVNKCENYKFSTLNGLLGFNNLTIPLVEDSILFNGDISDTLKWLNVRIDQKDLISFRNGLKKGEFKLRKNEMTRKLNHLEFDKV